jgi:membrane protease subunit HflK
MNNKKLLAFNNDNNQNKKDNGPPDLDEIFENLFSFLKKKKQKNGSGSNNNHSNDDIPVNKILAIVVTVAVFIWVGFGFYTVNEQEEGILLRLGKFDSVLSPGLHWQPAIIDKVEKVNVTRIREISTNGLMLTKDENIIRASVKIQYKISDPKKMLFNLRSSRMTILNALNSSLRHVVGSAGMSKILTSGRAEIANSIRDRLQGYLNKYNSGVTVIRANIESVRAPRQVQEAFDDVIKAREDRQRYINGAEAYANQIIPIARGDAKRQVAEAIGYKSSVINFALGESYRFTKILKEYRKSKKVTRQRMYLQTMEKIMQRTTKVVVDSSGKGGNMFVLPLDKIMSLSKSSNKPAGRSITSIIHDAPLKNITNRTSRGVR